MYIEIDTLGRHGDLLIEEKKEPKKEEPSKPQRPEGFIIYEEPRLEIIEHVS